MSEADAEACTQAVAVLRSKPAAASLIGRAAIAPLCTTGCGGCAVGGHRQRALPRATAPPPGEAQPDGRLCRPGAGLGDFSWAAAAACWSASLACACSQPRCQANPFPLPQTHQVDLFKPIMHTALLIWKHSRFYNTTARMATLLHEICNDLIAQVGGSVGGWAEVSGNLSFLLAANDGCAHLWRRGHLCSLSGSQP